MSDPHMYFAGKVYVHVPFRKVVVKICFCLSNSDHLPIGLAWHHRNGRSLIVLRIFFNKATMGPYCDLEDLIFGTEKETVEKNRVALFSFYAHCKQHFPYRCKHKASCMCICGKLITYV